MAVWTRKIQRTGPTSLGITLPRAWAKHLDLQLQDTVHLTEKDGKLVITPLEEDDDDAR